MGENVTIKLATDVTPADAKRIKALAKAEKRTLANTVRWLMLRGLETLTEGKAKR